MTTGQVVPPGQLQVAGEVIFLLRERRVVPVAVQARLADGHDARPRRTRRDHLVPVARRGLGDVVGLDADRGGQQRVALGQGDAGGAGSGGGGDGDDAARRRRRRRGRARRAGRRGTARRRGGRGCR